MPLIEINGIPHYVQWITDASQSVGSDPQPIDHDDTRFGSPDPTNRKPVMLFVHGWGGSARYWESTAQALRDRYDCLLYDLRGFGRTPARALPTDPLYRNPRDPIYRLEVYAQELGELLDRLELERVTINAHSMGASIATLFAAAQSDRVERLILTCSGIFDYDPVIFKTFHQASRVVVSLRPRWLQQIPGMDRLFMARFVYKPLPTLISQAFLADYLQADHVTILGTVYTSVSQEASETIPAAFKALQTPTLLISGAKDIIIPAELGRRAASLNPLTQFAEIPNTAHFPMLEDPDTYLSILDQFLT